MDEKEEKFKRLAENRTNKIIDMMRLLGNLSNRSNYSYTQEQVDSIFEAIEKELNVQKAKFEKQNDGRKKFRL